MTEGGSLRSRIMRSVRRARTKPEMIVRRYLHANGYRFRTNLSELPGSPDIVLTRRRKAIFVHGCFWHRHSGCRFASIPKTRTEFWQDKFDCNVERDKRKVDELTAGGWSVMTVWECQTRDMDTLAARIIEFLGSPRAPQPCRFDRTS